MKTQPLICLVASLLAGCAATATVGVPGPQPGPQAGPPPASRPAPSEGARGNSESVHTLGVPPGHLPKPGQCRVWIPGQPPGHQAKSRSCYGITQTAPAGSWILYRPSSNSNIVHVHVVDAVRVGVVVRVDVFNVAGQYLREERGDDHRDDEDDYREHGHGRGRPHNQH